jgi:hypothetical protein
MERVNFTFKNGHVRVMNMLQAKTLTKLGHGTYQTRMMSAAPVVAVIEEPVLTAELDSAGEPWDAEIHVATKLKNMNGTWRKKAR